METVSEFQRYFPETLTLETPRVLLRQLNESDYDELKKLTGSADLWKYFSKNLQDESELKKWIKEAVEERNLEKRMPFIVFDKDEKAICGSTSFGNISFYDKRIEIGWSWLGTQFLGTGINRNAKFALISYAFDAMKMERVEIKTDNLNERAKAALIKVGAKPEGVLKSHMQMWNDRRRDSIYFSLLKNEWKEIKDQFFPEMI